MRLREFIVLALSLIMIACNGNKEKAILSIIPYPAEVIQESGALTIYADQLTVASDDEFILGILLESLKSEKGLQVKQMDEVVGLPARKERVVVVDHFVGELDVSIPWIRNQPAYTRTVSRQAPLPKVVLNNKRMFDPG